MDGESATNIVTYRRRDGKFASRSATPSPSHRRAKRLEAVDGRTVAGKRVAKLRELFTAELTSAGAELSPIRRLKIDQAANAIAVAELARSRYLQNGSGDLSDLVAAERRADAAIKRLGLPPEGPSAARAPELREYLGGKVGGG